MLKKIVVIMLIGLVTNVTVFAGGSGKNKQDDTAKARAAIAKLGTGSDAKVNIKLKSGKKIKGYVSETKADSFVVIDKNGTQTEVQYSQAKQVRGTKLTTGQKIGLIGGLALAGVLIGTAIGLLAR